MGKKKNRNRDNRNHQSSNVVSPAKDVFPSNDKEVLERDYGTDPKILSICIVQEDTKLAGGPSVMKNKIPNPWKYDPVLNVHPSAMSAFHSKCGLLASKGFLVWCRVQDKEAPNSSSRRLSNSPRNRFKETSCTLSPSYVQHNFFTTFEEKQSNLEIGSASPSSAVVSTPSSPFTFKSPKSTTPVRSSATNSRKEIATFVPSALIDQKYIGIAEKIYITIEDMHTSFLQRSDDKAAFEAIAKAVLQNAVVVKDSCIEMSFKGRQTSIIIGRIESKRTRIDSCDLDKELNVAMQQLVKCSLFEKIEENNLESNEDQVRLLLQNCISEISLPLIFHVNASTAICLEETVPQNPSVIKENIVNPYVVGLDKEKQEIMSILCPSILEPWRFTQLSGKGIFKPPRGVLVFGPPGTGKSALAKQIANEFTDMNLSGNVIKKIHVKWVQCGSLLSSVVGKSEKFLSSLFREADVKANQGESTLIIFDDIELICARRGTAESMSTDKTTATFLALLDGIGEFPRHVGHSNDQSIGNVAILAVTSRPVTLDPALRRPGRLDFEVELSIPNERVRAEIMTAHINNHIKGKVPDLTPYSISHLARQAKGFTGADIVLAIKAAIRNSILGAHDDKDFVVTLKAIEIAISKTTPSSIRGVVVEVPEVKWDDIGGMHNVKCLLRETIEYPIKYAHHYEMFKIRAAKGVLLYGPPGCSKTLMARALATEGDMNFLAVKGPELLSKWLGESERALAALFRRARQAAPCLVFFDEIDAIASKRGNTDSGSSGDRLLSQLLTELDGITPLKRVIIVGATNRPDLLDDALTRPGRIDRKIYVGAPDFESRESILSIGLKGKPLCSDVDISTLAHEDVTGGFSGAELISICREAALHAIEEYSNGESERTMIALRHLQKSIKDTKPQITSEMIAFYAKYQGRDVVS